MSPIDSRGWMLAFSRILIYGRFQKIGVPQNGWLIMENLIKLDDLGTTIFGNIHISHPSCFSFRIRPVKDVVRWQTWVWSGKSPCCVRWASHALLSPLPTAQLGSFWGALCCERLEHEDVELIKSFVSLFNRIWYIVYSNASYKRLCWCRYTLN